MKSHVASREYYRSRAIKRPRRAKRDVEAICRTIYKVVSINQPMTVRQVFYRLVGEGVISKTENEYHQTVIRLLRNMRLESRIPFGWIADNTRWMRKPRTYSDMEDALRKTAAFYRRALWRNQPVYVEVWLEKDALAGVLSEETDKWDVPLMVTRGYASLSFLYEAADAIKNVGKPVYLYYFGDFDPSGIDIPKNIESRLREFAPEADIHFQRVAVNPDQIAKFNLPTRPTKKTDSRSKQFHGESVEVDSIPPKVLRKIAADCIKRHIDKRALEQTQIVEKDERRTFQLLLNKIGI